jgi:hypothetical protein
VSRGWVIVALVLVVGGVLGTTALPSADVAKSTDTDLQNNRPAALSSISQAEPATASPYLLNGRFLLLNMHGFLFQDDPRDYVENLAYARWMHAGVIRVFATDANRQQPWDGERVGNTIADLAPSLREYDVKLLVALVNNHQPVPGEKSDSVGMMDGYFQHLLPFYEGNWRGAYRTFLRDLISTVRDRGALDVIQAWELGNEIHTQQSPPVVMSFVKDAVAEIRRVDAKTPIYPGSMGVNHLDPWHPESPIARWLYCEAPIDAYTLHAYDWVSRERQGDMPIDWDLDYITATPCPSGRELPVIVEELGASRELDGMYTAADETKRLAQELRQIRFVLDYPQVRGIGAWNGVSPRVVDKGYYDGRRGLTSYGPDDDGSGSCYDPTPLPSPGARCQLEEILRNLPALPQ